MRAGSIWTERHAKEVELNVSAKRVGNDVDRLLLDRFRTDMRANDELFARLPDPDDLSRRFSGQIGIVKKGLDFIGLAMGKS